MARTQTRDLQKELDNALMALHYTRQKLIESQEELRKLKWMLVQKEESDGKHS